MGAAQAQLGQQTGILKRSLGRRKKDMARTKPEEIVDDLSSNFRRALKDAVSEILPGAPFDEYALFRAFKRAVRRKCSTWERVSDSNVDV
jgi:hypothetical protein